MAVAVDEADLAIRHDVYAGLARTGRAPTVAELSDRHGPDAAARLESLADAHMLVLDDTGEVRMALPFSAVSTGHIVRAGDRGWWANCAWDALAIPLLLDIDAEIEATWLDDETSFHASMNAGAYDGPDGLVHFQRPAARWWDDIVET